MVLEYNTSLRDRVLLYNWDLILFLIIAFPRILRTPKLVLCVLIIVLGITKSQVIKIDKYLASYFATKLIYTILIISTGIIYGNNIQAINASARLNLIYSVLFILIIERVYSINGFFEHSVWIVTAATLYLGIYNLIMVLFRYFGISVSVMEGLDATGGVTFHTGYIHIISTNLSMSIITFPLLMFLFSHRDIDKKVKRFMAITLMLCGLAMALSGRRILWICLVFSLIMLLFLESKDTVKVFQRVLIVVLFILGIVILARKTNLLDYEGVSRRFISAYRSSDSEGTIRSIQAKKLLSGFAKKPIFGSGAGATIDGYYRNQLTPWVFELSYYVILFQSGVVGSVVFWTGIIILFYIIRKVRAVDKTVFHSCFCAFIMALISNATNPYYTSSFDFIIFLFLPVALAKAVCYVNRPVMKN